MPPRDKSTLRLLIQQKLDDGLLPQNSIPRVWGGPGSGEGISKDARNGIIFHVQCFYLWDTLRKVEGDVRATGIFDYVMEDERGRLAWRATLGHAEWRSRGDVPVHPARE